MLSLEHPDRIQISFDDHRLVNNAGLILPATLALHLGLPQLVQQRLDLDNAPGRANTGDKMMTLVASALAGGDCIEKTPTCCALGEPPAPWAARSRRHPPWEPSCTVSGGVPRQLYLPVGSGEPRVAGKGLGGSGRTGRHAPDHRPGLYQLRDLRTGQGGCPPPQLHRPAGLSHLRGQRGRPVRQRGQRLTILRPGSASWTLPGTYWHASTAAAPATAVGSTPAETSTSASATALVSTSSFDRGR